MLKLKKAPSGEIKNALFSIKQRAKSNIECTVPKHPSQFKATTEHSSEGMHIDAREALINLNTECSRPKAKIVKKIKTQTDD
jgi:hypothetical protein